MFNYVLILFLKFYYTLSSEIIRRGPKKIDSSAHLHMTPCHGGTGINSRVSCGDELNRHVLLLDTVKTKDKNIFWADEAVLHFLHRFNYLSLTWKSSLMMVYCGELIVWFVSVVSQTASFIITSIFFSFWNQNFFTVILCKKNVILFRIYFYHQTTNSNKRWLNLANRILYFTWFYLCMAAPGDLLGVYTNNIGWS